MSDARWLDIEEAAASAKRHLEGAIRLFETAEFRDGGLPAYRDRMAFMHAIQSAHTPLEGALLRILDLLGEERPTGEHWHQDLIQRVCRAIEDPNPRPAILSRELCGAIDETRRFRNLAVRGYDTFDPEKALPTVAAARLIADGLLPAIRMFKETADGA